MDKTPGLKSLLSTQYMKVLRTGRVGFIRLPLNEAGDLSPPDPDRSRDTLLKPKTIVFTLLGLVLLAAIGFFAVDNNLGGWFSTPIPTPTLTFTPTATSTDTPTATATFTLTLPRTTTSTFTSMPTFTPTATRTPLPYIPPTATEGSNGNGGGNGQPTNQPPTDPVGGPTPIG
jgi:hypothetical protein